MIPDSVRDFFYAFAEQRDPEPGIWRVRISDRSGRSSGNVRVESPLDLAAGIEALWPHDIDPADAEIDVALVERLPPWHQSQM